MCGLFYDLSVVPDLPGYGIVPHKKVIWKRIREYRLHYGVCQPSAGFWLQRRQGGRSLLRQLSTCRARSADCGSFAQSNV